MSGPALDSAESFARVLHLEQLRNGRQIALFRLTGLSGVIAISMLFTALWEGFTGPPPAWIVPYWLGAALLFWVRRVWPNVARFDGMTPALVDMPMIAIILYSVIRNLHARGLDADAVTLASFSPLYFALFTLMAALWLEVRPIVAAAATGLVLQTLLLSFEGANQSFMIAQGALCLLLTAALGLYMRERTARLVGAFADEQLRRARLGRYFSPQVAAHVAERSADLNAGEVRQVTVLFADLRDFTALADRLDARAVVSTLNEFHGRMVEQIFRFDGTLDKFMGDGLMAYFGAPVTRPDHATQAVRCALAMQDELIRLNVERRQRADAPLRMGIGMHSGPVVLGDIGAARRREFTAIGDTVNVAGRIEQLTKTHGVGILLSEATRQQVGGEIAFTAAPPVVVKGKPEPLRTYVPSIRDQA